jgi:hypothetical protein
MLGSVGIVAVQGGITDGVSRVGVGLLDWLDHNGSCGGGRWWRRSGGGWRRWWRSCSGWGRWWRSGGGGRWGTIHVNSGFCV